MPRSTKGSLSLNYTQRFWTLFFKLNASHTSLISIVRIVTSWKLLWLLVWTPFKIRMKNLAVPTFSSGTVCSLYKVFNNVPFWAQFTQFCAHFFLPTFRNNTSVSSSRIIQSHRTILTLRLLMSHIYIYIYGAPILDISRSHTTTHHSR